jgi:hypothetical protein
MQKAVKAYDTDIEYLKAKPDFEWTTPEIPEEPGDRTFDYEKSMWVVEPGKPAVPPQSHTKRADAEKAFDTHIEAAIKRASEMGDYERKYGSGAKPIHLGEYRGLNVFYDPAQSATISDNKSAAPVFVQGASGERYSVAPSLQSIEYVARNIPKRRDELQKFVEGGERQIETAEKNLGKKFPKQADLEKKSAELQKLNDEMNPPKPGKEKSAAKPAVAQKPQAVAPKPVSPPPQPVVQPSVVASQEKAATHHVLSGNTFAHKDKIKQLGGRWDADKKVWRIPVAKTEADKKRLAEGLENMSGVMVGSIAMSLDYVAGYDDPSLVGVHFYDPDYVAGYDDSPMRLAAANPWEQRRGPRGGHIWVNSKTGDERHQVEQPAAKPSGFAQELKHASELNKLSRQPVPDKLIGGKADGMPDSAFNAEALAAGTKQEMEHTSDPEIAKEIAKDGLVEDPGMYDNRRAVHPGKLTVGKKPHVTETPEFKKWFAGSKIVDKQGLPLRVFHGTQADFGEFRGGMSEGGAMFFSISPKQAGEFAEPYPGAKGAAIMPVYLRMENPMQVSFKGNLYTPEAMERLIEVAKKRGHDGIIANHIVNFEGGKPSTSFAVFDNKQVKSASGNRGTFDTDNPDIRMGT